MKKLATVFFLIIIIYFGTFKNVLGSDGITVKIIYDEAIDGILVTGVVDNERANIPLTLKVEKEDGTFFAGFQTTAKRNKNDEITFAFEPIKFPYTAESGIYKFYVSGHHVNVSNSELYSYLSIVDTYNLLQSINELISNGGEGLYDLVLQNSNEINVSVSQLQILDSNAKKVFNESLKLQSYTLPESYDSEENITIIKSKFILLRQNCAKALALALFDNIKSRDTLDAWFSQCFPTLGFNLEDPKTSYSEVSICNYLNLVMDTTSFVNRIASQNNLIQMADVKNAIYKSVLLTAIETLHFRNTYSIMTEFVALFPVNNNNLAKIRTEHQGELYMAIANKYYENCEDVTSTFDALVLATITENTTSSNSSKSKWGDSGNSVYIAQSNSTQKSFENSQTSKFDSKEVSLFNDLSTVSWAIDAISYLAEKKIVIGNDNGTFSPNDYVTRAEFIKMLVIATNAQLNENETSSFTDVPSNKWYYKYITTAEKLGLVFGNDANEFLPNSYITRQDMAVLLYRTFVNKEVEGNLTFVDAMYVSDYAKKAILYYSKNEIIKGVGENTLEPLSNATRAQAAQMLYNVLKKKIK